jgi:4-hydroxy-tetrahydrodipicolinate reductase
MSIRVCVAGATGWAGAAVTRHIVSGGSSGSGLAATDHDFELVAAVARQRAGSDIGEVLGFPPVGIRIEPTVEEALRVPTDVLIDYTRPTAVKAHTLIALDRGVRVVIGTSGLTAVDYDEINRVASERSLGVIAAGNFSITAALAKRFALMAAKYVPSWELIDYAHAHKIDAPSGTVRELAEELEQVGSPKSEVPIEQIHGDPTARGASIAGTQVHSIRLPGYVIAFEAVFGLPDERLTVRHDAGAGAGPYVAGTLLAAREVLRATGLIRGLDRLLFET